MISFDRKSYGCISPVELKSIKYRILYWILFAILMILVVIIFLPCLWVMLSGFKSVKEMYQVPPTFFPEHIRISKISDVWNKFNFLRSYISTFIMSLGEIGFGLFFPPLAGYVLSRLRPKGYRFVLVLLLWTMLLPGQTRMIPLFMMFVKVPLIGLNLTDTYWPLWLMAATNTFYVLLFKSFFDSIPNAYLESARIDGATKIGIFWKIILPLSKPIFMVIAIFIMNDSWSRFLWPFLILKSERLQVVSVKLFLMKSESQIDEYMLAIIFSIIPSVLLYIIFQKQMLKGMDIGGIKG